MEQIDPDHYVFFLALEHNWTSNSKRTHAQTRTRVFPLQCAIGDFSATDFMNEKRRTDGFIENNHVVDYLPLSSRI